MQRLKVRDPRARRLVRRLLQRGHVAVPGKQFRGVLPHLKRLGIATVITDVNGKTHIILVRRPRVIDLGDEIILKVRATKYPRGTRFTIW